jgi:hypothetical protein
MSLCCCWNFFYQTKCFDLWMWNGCYVFPHLFMPINVFNFVTILYGRTWKSYNITWYRWNFPFSVWANIFLNTYSKEANRLLKNILFIEKYNIDYFILVKVFHIPDKYVISSILLNNIANNDSRIIYISILKANNWFSALINADRIRIYTIRNIFIESSDNYNALITSL